MEERLFVYGTLAPGKPNEHVLACLAGEWIAASVKGKLYDKGWGAVLGYPAIVLDPEGEDVNGLVFSSDELAGFWSELDKFEGEAYQRVKTPVCLESGQVTDAYVYVISSSELHEN